MRPGKENPFWSWERTVSCRAQTCLQLENNSVQKTYELGCHRHRLDSLLLKGKTHRALSPAGGDAEEVLHGTAMQTAIKVLEHLESRGVMLLIAGNELPPPQDFMFLIKQPKINQR